MNDSYTDPFTCFFGETSVSICLVVDEHKKLKSGNVEPYAR